MSYAVPYFTGPSKSRLKAFLTPWRHVPFRKLAKSGESRPIPYGRTVYNKSKPTRACHLTNPSSEGQFSWYPLAGMGWRPILGYDPTGIPPNIPPDHATSILGPTQAHVKELLYKGLTLRVIEPNTTQPHTPHPKMRPK